MSLGAWYYRMEERQRAERREREKKGDKVEPKWFRATGETTQTPWGELELYEFNGKYLEHRRALDGGKETAIMQADPDAATPPIVFDPWQYKALSEAIPEPKPLDGLVVN